MACRLTGVLVLRLMVLLVLEELVNNCSSATARTAAALLVKGTESHPRQVARQLRQLQRPPFKPEAFDEPSSPPPAEKFDIIEGELHVYINEAGPPSFLIYVSNGSIVPVSLGETEAAEALQYAGHTVRLHVAANSSAISFVPNEALSREQSLQKRSSRQQASFEGPPSQDSIPVKGLMCNDCMTPTDSLVAPTSARSNGGHDNPQPIIISTVVFLISFCGYGPAIDVASFRSMWLNGPDTPPNTRTMQNTFDYCSQGKAIMNSSTQHIFDVPLQCTGKVPGTSTPYNYAQLDTICYTYSLHNMMLVAEDYVQKTLGIDISSIKQRIAVLPVDLSGYCDFGGMAGLGCTGTRCYSWINGLFAGNLYLYLHEMGHNLGLYHSRIPGRDYGDETCTMGNGRTCYNAPNMWRLGWVSPLPGGDLNDTTLPVGQPMIFYLPGQNENPHSYLRINPTWATTGSQTYSRLKAPIPAFFISHRYKEVPFDNLSPANSHIAVHTFSGTQDPQSYQNVTLEAFLFVKEEYRAPMPFNLVVRFVTYKSGGNATIIICRADGEEEGGGSSCSDGLDNDCDGLVDFADPDCAYVAPKPPSPRLPPSPRRSPPRPPASSPSQLQSPPSSPSQPQPPPSSPSQPQPPASPPDSPLPPSPPPLLPSPPGTPLHREPPFPPPPPSPRPPPFPRPPPRPPAFPRSPPRSPPPSLTPPTMTPSR